MKLPELYFRIRENGAAVFRVDAENRQGRLNLDPLAFANVRSGEIRVQGSRALSEAERAAIKAWIAGRRETLRARDKAGTAAAVEAINAAAHWAQTKASDAEIEEVAADLLMAMHDLRTVLVRRQAEATEKS